MGSEGGAPAFEMAVVVVLRSAQRCSVATCLIVIANIGSSMWWRTRSLSGICMEASVDIVTLSPRTAMRAIPQSSCLIASSKSWARSMSPKRT